MHHFDAIACTFVHHTDRLSLSEGPEKKNIRFVIK